jgi:hypothetical protein
MNANTTLDSKYEIRVTQLSVLPPKEQLFSTQRTTVSIVDEAAGEFLEIEQYPDADDRRHVVRIDKDEWPTVKLAIEQLLPDLRFQDDSTQT